MNKKNNYPESKLSSATPSSLNPLPYINSLLSISKLRRTNSVLGKQINISLLNCSSTRTMTMNSSYGFLDTEKISEDIKSINREIRFKKLEYESIKKDFEQLEQENTLILKILDSILTECLEGKETLDKSSKITDNKEKNNKMLIEKLNNKFNSFKKELYCTEARLNEIKRNERTMKILELENLIKETNNNIKKYKNEHRIYLNKINSINKETFKTNLIVKTIKHKNYNLKNEIKDYLNKTNVLKDELKVIDIKKNNLQEKISTMKKIMDSAKSSIEKREQEIKALKVEEAEYKDLLNKKQKNENQIYLQLKKIILLNEQINKRMRQINESQRMIKCFENHVKDLYAKEDEIKEDTKNIEEINNKKNEKQNLLDEMKKLNEILQKYRFKKYPNDILSKEKIVSFNLNVPIKLEI